MNSSAHRRNRFPVRRRSWSARAIRAWAVAPLVWSIPAFMLNWFARENVHTQINRRK